SADQVRIAAPPHRRFEKRDRTAEEHAEAVSWRGFIAPDLQVATQSPQICHRGEADAKRKPELARGQTSHPGQLGAGSLYLMWRHHDDRSVSPEQERYQLWSTEILQRRDRHRGDKIDRLVATPCNSGRRIDDICHHQGPVIGCGSIPFKIKGVVRMVDRGQAGEKARHDVARCGQGDGPSPLALACASNSWKLIMCRSDVNPRAPGARSQSCCMVAGPRNRREMDGAQASALSCQAARRAAATCRPAARAGSAAAPGCPPSTG